MTLTEAYIVRLTELLKERNITFYKFAKESCIPHTTIENLKKKVTKSPSLKLIYQTANGLGMSVIEFLDSPLFRSDDIEFL